MSHSNDILTVLKQYKALGVSRVVFCEKEAQEYLSSCFKDEECTYIPDVRSATFFAYGQSKLLGSPVLLVLDERFIASTYTGLTEAWMQRIQVCVLAYNCNGYKNTLYLEKCTDTILCLDGKTDDRDIVKKAFQCHGPSIVKCDAFIQSNNKEDYSDIFDLLSQSGYKDIVHCYEPSPYDGNLRVTVISEKYKYGILSKYIGELLGGKDSILCIPDHLLNLESNAFVQRIIPQSFKLIVKETNKELCDRFESWITSNSFITYRDGSVKESIEMLLQSDKACVAFIS